MSERAKELTRKENAIQEILSAVMQHKFAKTEDATKIWYDKIREGLKEYYNAVAEDCKGRSD